MSGKLPLNIGVQTCFPVKPAVTLLQPDGRGLVVVICRPIYMRGRQLHDKDLHLKCKFQWILLWCSGEDGRGSSMQHASGKREVSNKFRLESSLETKTQFRIGNSLWYRSVAWKYLRFLFSRVITEYNNYWGCIGRKEFFLPVLRSSTFQREIYNKMLVIFILSYYLFN